MGGTQQCLTTNITVWEGYCGGPYDDGTDMQGRTWTRHQGSILSSLTGLSRPYHGKRLQHNRRPHFLDGQIWKIKHGPFSASCEAFPAVRSCPFEQQLSLASCQTPGVIGALREWLERVPYYRYYRLTNRYLSNGTTTEIVLSCQPFAGRKFGRLAPRAFARYERTPVCQTMRIRRMVERWLQSNLRSKQCDASSNQNAPLAISVISG